MTAEASMNGFFRVEELPTKVLAGIQLRSVHLENLMITFVDYPEGSSVAAHHHRHEQITYVLEGCLEVTLAGETRVLAPGDGVRIGANVEHSSRPVDGAAKALDAWTPVPKRYKVEPATTLGHHVPISGESLS
ncbi:MAG: cupin domain-containing protein [Candidatus Binatia bacterium]